MSDDHAPTLDDDTPLEYYTVCGYPSALPAQVIGVVGVGSGGAELARALRRHLAARAPAGSVRLFSEPAEVRRTDVAVAPLLLFVAEDDGSPPEIAAELVDAARAAGNRALRVGPVSGAARQGDDGRLLLARGTRVFDAAEALVSTLVAPGIVGFDFRDLCAATHRSGPLRVSVGNGPTCLAAAEAALAAWPDEERRTCTTALLNIESSDPTLQAISDAANVIADALHDDADIRFAASVLPESSPSCRVTVLLSAPAAPGGAHRHR